MEKQPYIAVGSFMLVLLALTLSVATHNQAGNNTDPISSGHQLQKNTEGECTAQCHSEAAFPQKTITGKKSFRVFNLLRSSPQVVGSWFKSRADQREG